MLIYMLILFSGKSKDVTLVDSNGVLIDVESKYFSPTVYSIFFIRLNAVANYYFKYSFILIIVRSVKRFEEGAQL